MAALVILLPFFDRWVCYYFDVQPEHHIGDSPREQYFLNLRRLVLLLIFALYCAANVYLVFFSRSASQEYMIHVAPLDDLRKSVKIDSGILGTLAAIYTQGLSEGFSRIHIEKPQDIAQVYMNIMLYVPMGYLLPYTFDWCRARMRSRPVLVSFLLSFLTENMQLIFKRGFYDIDDLLANTFGAFIGQLLFISVGYVVTHPNWRADLKDLSRWRRLARHSLLGCLSKKGTMRVTLIVSSVSIVNKFFAGTLGFRPVEHYKYPESGVVEYLVQAGSLQLILLTGEEPPRRQFLSLPVQNIDKVARRLQRLGYRYGKPYCDPFTGTRMLQIEIEERDRDKKPHTFVISFIES